MGWGSCWPAFQVEDGLLAVLLVLPEELENALSPVYPILRRDLDLSSAVVIMEVKVLEVFRLVPVAEGL